MPTTCEVERFYLGSVGPLTRLYAGDTLVWPCYNCLPDLELLDSQYADAIMYIPEVCESEVGPDRLSEYFSDVSLIRGPAFTSMWSVSFAPGVDATYGFDPPLLEDDYGEILVEAELSALDTFGQNTSSISFYIELSEEIDVDNEGLLFQIGEIEVEIQASVFFGTTLLARVNRSSPEDPLEIQSSTDLLLNEETHIIVQYQKNTGDDRLTIYYDLFKVAEVIG